MKEVGTFAGGCFWCIESAFKVASKTILKGITKVTSGYCGGTKKNPKYQDSGDHLESVQVEYDPSEVKYEQLLNIFWKQIDPTDADGQFADRGDNYKTAIFFHNTKQKKAAEDSKKELENSHRFNAPIATKILKSTDFYPAEDYHQDYSEKNPIQYKIYKRMSGREGFVKAAWKK